MWLQQFVGSLQHTVTHCDTLQHTVTHCNVLRRTATHCNALRRTATHCTALRRQAPCQISFAKTTTRWENMRRRWGKTKCRWYNNRNCVAQKNHLFTGLLFQSGLYSMCGRFPIQEGRGSQQLVSSPQG